MTIAATRRHDGGEPGDRVMPDPCPPKKDGYGNGTKALITLAALAGIIWMLWQAQASNVSTLERLTNQRLDLMTRELEEASIHRRLAAHPVAAQKELGLERELEIMRGRMREDDKREIEDAGELKRLNERLREIETQFRHADQLTQLLWQRVYNEPLPNPVARNAN